RAARRPERDHGDAEGDQDRGRDEAAEFEELSHDVLLGCRLHSPGGHRRSHPEFAATAIGECAEILAQRSPGSLTPRASARKAGTGSASGLATSSTAPNPSSGVSASTRSWSPTASAN